MDSASGEGRIRRRFDLPRSAGRLSLWVCLFVYLTWVQLQGREGLDADLIRGETPAGRPRAYSRHWAQTSAGGAAGAGRGAGARKEGGLEGKLGLI